MKCYRLLQEAVNASYLEMAISYEEEFKAVITIQDSRGNVKSRYECEYKVDDEHVPYIEDKVFSSILQTFATLYLRTAETIK